MQYHDTDPVTEAGFDSIFESVKAMEAEAVEEAVQIISVAIHSS